MLHGVQVNVNSYEGGGVLGGSEGEVSESGDGIEAGFGLCELGEIGDGFDGSVFNDGAEG